MQQNNPEKEKLNAIRLLRLIIKWKRHLILTGLGALLFSFVFTLPVFMTPMFKASAVIYPVNLSSYSQETPTEQMVQLLQSEDVKEMLIKTFNLYEHYEIDTTGKYPRFEIMKRLEENISVSKTELESVELFVLDKDPKLAARMCDSLISFMDTKATSLLRERAREIMVITGTQMREKKAELDSLENALMKIRTEYGITDYENMINGFSREYFGAIRSGGANARMETMRRNLETKGGDYLLITSLLEPVRRSYSDYKLKFELAETDSRKELKYHNTITRPVAPERKDSPKRSLIMLVFTISVLFVAMLIIIYQEHYKKKLEEEISQG
jgi:uncharacterized protein involved in exopolysaccharide biosynthesis